ncbi:MAG: DUF971 domain-containing protein [Deltaproteobacteria bacterium]|nr:DUF971 domain-containing protein [Deltaproteobacteria bacterium]
MKVARQAQPSKIKRVVGDDGRRGKGLDVSWSDGVEISYDAGLLRRHCPCADCAQEREQLEHKKGKFSFNVIKASAAQSTDLRQVWAIGNYAFGMLWADGHQAGIYTYDQLRELADLVPSKN